MKTKYTFITYKTKINNVFRLVTARNTFSFLWYFIFAFFSVWPLFSSQFVVVAVFCEIFCALQADLYFVQLPKKWDKPNGYRQLDKKRTRNLGKKHCRENKNSQIKQPTSWNTKFRRKIMSFKWNSISYREISEWAISFAEYH